MDCIKGLLNTDGYKLDHRRQYPAGTQRVYSNWTPRATRIEGVDHVVFVGLQYVVQRRLMDDWVAFFDAPVDLVCEQYQDFLDSYLGKNAIGTGHIRDLHRLGYLPIEIKAVPEGTHVPVRVPMFTIENTHPDFFWLTNYFETVLSSELWMPMTSATNAMRIRGLLDKFAAETSDAAGFVDYQAHDFSMRGMAGLDAAIGSGMGHLVPFSGTDTIPAVIAIRQFYGAQSMVGTTVPATEHSVMCAGGQDGERDTFLRILDLYPEGIVSAVSDTWDFWGVLTTILPSIKDRVMARNGKLVIRPDSGDPVEIICGTHRTGGETPEERGAIQLLYDCFGGTVNSKGYIDLDPHIGLIYGDSMTYDRIKRICERLKARGFSSTNAVYGIGSYSYQYQTRDVFGFAMKATNVVIDGVEKEIFKDPKTDNGTKKSLRGRIAVVEGDCGIVAKDRLQSTVDGDLLQLVWKNGTFMKLYDFNEVRQNAFRSSPWQ